MRSGVGKDKGGTGAPAVKVEGTKAQVRTNRIVDPAVGEYEMGHIDEVGTPTKENLKIEFDKQILDFDVT